MLRIATGDVSHAHLAGRQPQCTPRHRHFAEIELLTGAAGACAHHRQSDFGTA
jgi:hypothetical protein